MAERVALAKATMAIVGERRMLWYLVFQSHARPP